MAAMAWWLRENMSSNGDLGGDGGRGGNVIFVVDG